MRSGQGALTGATAKLRDVTLEWDERSVIRLAGQPASPRD